MRPGLSTDLAAAVEFQSTHPRGVRPTDFYGRVRFKMISIHAPTWGATSRKQRIWYIIRFQSTHPRGVRLLLTSLIVLLMVFQSTHPRGVRLGNLTTDSPVSNFNPRTHVGCDQRDQQAGHYRTISIHAPTWGATWESHYGFTCFKFQSTHPRGVRPT